MSSIFARFQRDERGAIVLLFGLMLIPLIGIVGLAIDSARAYAVRNQLQQAVDAAALSGGRVFALPAAQRDSVITAFFNQNLQSTRFGATLTAPLTIQANPGAGTLRVSANANMPVTLMKVMGFSTVPVASSATIQKKDTTLEVALVLDVSGSMLGSKIAGLKTAAKLFVDTVYPSGADPKAQVSIVPWDDMVYAKNALSDPDSLLMPGEPSQPTIVPYSPCAFWGPCLSLSNPFVTVTPDGWGYYAASGVMNVSAYPAFTFPDPASPMLIDESVPLGQLKAAWYAWDASSNNEVTPLRHTPSTIKAAIDNLVANGNTGSPGGVFWGWRTISPLWQGRWKSVPPSLPLPYGTMDNFKAMVIMTDGQNNTMWYNSGYSHPSVGSMNSTTVQQCTAMKAKGIRIYTIGFNLSGTGSPPAIMLRDCASSPSSFFYSADPAALTAAFQAIASDLAALRLTH